MRELDMRYGITIRIDSKGPGIYILGHSIEDAMNVLVNDGNIYDEMKWNAMDILRKAQECNATLREIQNIYGKGKLSISFEFRIWENFLDFKKMTEEHFQQ